MNSRAYLVQKLSEQRDCLDSLSKPHIVCQDASGPVQPKAVQPAQPNQLK